MPDHVTKPCSKCGEVKFLDEFSKDAKRKDGRANTCRQCRAERARQYYLDHRDETRERNQQWYAANREDVLAQRRQYRAENPRQFTQEQREDARQRTRQWREDNPEQARESKKRWAQNNPEKRREGTVRHRERNPLYKTWEGMLARCENPASKDYKNYGARGIRVCAEWHDFKTFAADIERLLGPKPAGYSIDRKDNSGNYEGVNVRWASAKEQANNRRPLRPRA
jgi:hypothetical protein